MRLETAALSAGAWHRQQAATERKRSRFRWGAFSRGALYELLRNRIYLGQITHKGVPFAGQHPAILEEELWSQVQAQLLANLQERNHRARSTEPSLLTGLLTDASGNRFTPTHASKGGRRYRYYTSQAGGNDRTKSKPMRLPAAEMEAVVTRRVVELLQSPQTLLDALSSSQDLVEVQGTLRVLEFTDRDLASRALDVVQSSVRAVVLYADHLQITVSKERLWAVHAGSGATPRGFETED